MKIKGNLKNDFFDSIDDTQEIKPAEKNIMDDLSVLKENAENGDVCAQMKLGRYYHHMNNCKLALVYYGLAADKNIKEAVSLMADIYIKSKNYDKAIQCYEKLESIDGKSRNLEIGRLLLKKRNKSEAVEYIKKAVESGDKEAVEILETLNSVPDIKLMEEKALLRKNREAALDLAEYYYDSDSYLSAFWYHFAYTHNYVYPLVNEQINTIFGTPPYSDEKLKRIEDHVNTVQYVKFKNKISRLYGEIDELEQVFKASKDLSLLIELGDKYESLGKHTQALQKYLMAIDRGVKEAYVKVAEVYMRTGDFYNGMYWLQKSANHNDVIAYWYLTKVYKEMNDKDNLLECYLKLSDLGDKTVYIQMAKLYEEKMQLSEAIAYYKKIVMDVDLSDECIDFGNSGLKIEDVKNKILTLEKLYSLSSDPIERLERIFSTYRKYARSTAIKLGTVFYEGNDVKIDYRKSAYWYKQAKSGHKNY